MKGSFSGTSSANCNGLLFVVHIDVQYLQSGAVVGGRGLVYFFGARLTGSTSLSIWTWLHPELPLVALPTLVETLTFRRRQIISSESIRPTP
jgi:hypothetical protein